MVVNDSIKYKFLYELLLKRLNILFVMVDRIIGNKNYLQVYFDNKLGGYMVI